MSDIKDVDISELKLEMIADARKDFYTFMLVMFSKDDELNDWVLNRKEILPDICDSFTEGWNSKQPVYRIALSTPPRFGKTTTINYFIAWSIGKDINRSIIRCSYSQDTVYEANQGVRLILEDERYKAIFPNLPPMTTDTKGKISFEGGHRATLYATSVGGSVTGFGGAILISDDIYKDHNEALSESINEKTISWYDSAFKSRGDSPHILEIVVGTRWRIGELVDIMERRGDFDKVLKYKALTDDNKSFCENVIPTTRLLDYKKTYPKLLFNSMYQQEPMVSESACFTKDEMNFIHPETEYSVYSRIAMIDPKSTGKDDFVIAIGSIVSFKPPEETTEDDLEILVENFFKTDRVLDNTLQNNVVFFLGDYEPERVFVEDNKDPTFCRNLRNEIQFGSKRTVVNYNTHMNKQLKIITHANLVKRMYFFDPSLDKNGILDEAYVSSIDDILSFDPKYSKKDDVVDCITMLSMIILNYGRDFGFDKWDLNLKRRRKSDE